MSATEAREALFEEIGAVTAHTLVAAPDLATAVASAFMHGLTLGIALMGIPGGNDFARWLLGDIDTTLGTTAAQNLIETVDTERAQRIVAAYRSRAKNN